MTRIFKALGLTTALLLPVAAFAQSADANGDGVLTIDEVQVVLPDITAEAFSAMDTNADGALDAAEVQAAQDAGLIPA
ncbi:EF-hand domain-containing protein [Roseobacter weihaiensis]|uniref:hypothetical protein n=1 Tax=Roseobacter weihaiensis TaxID=2763262 RepID=UPI001D0A51B6|nr:hypothetical protein [Roseobacter sp. H9]